MRPHGRVTSWKAIEADMRHDRGAVYVRKADQTVWWNTQRPSMPPVSEGDSAVTVTVPASSFRIHPNLGLLDVDRIKERYPKAFVVEAGV